MRANETICIDSSPQSSDHADDTLDEPVNQPVTAPTDSSDVESMELPAPPAIFSDNNETTTRTVDCNRRECTDLRNSNARELEIKQLKINKLMQELCDARAKIIALQEENMKKNAKWRLNDNLPTSDRRLYVTD